MCVPAMSVYLAFIIVVVPSHVDATYLLIVCCLVAIIAQVTIIQCLTYLVTPISWKLDWDPDNVVIPVLMSISDCSGNAILLTAFLFLQYMEDPNSVGQPEIEWRPTNREQRTQTCRTSDSIKGTQSIFITRRKIIDCRQQSDDVIWSNSGRYYWLCEEEREKETRPQINVKNLKFQPVTTPIVCVSPVCGGDILNLANLERDACRYMKQVAFQRWWL